MPTAKLSGLVTRLGRGPDAIESATDAELLQRFAASRDEAAFAELVRRHGRLVYGVCRRATNSHHLAEDAFQAVFVVLATKAASIRPPSAVAAWLHGVACRTALRARTMADRRRRRETLVGDVPEATSHAAHEAPDAVAVLDEEIARLPDHYRLPVVLCELEGVGRKDAARRLGIAEGTLSSRLAAARKALADRLRSRGVALSAAGLSAAFARAAGANPPRALAAKAAAAATPASVPAPVAALSQGVLRIMFLNKLKLATPLAVLAVAALAYAALAAEPPTTPTPPAPLALVANNEPVPAKADPKALAPRPSKLVLFRSGQLVMIDADGKNEKKLTEKGEYHPSGAFVSPDGKHLAVLVPGPLPADDGTPGAKRRAMSLHVRGIDEKEPGTDLGVQCVMFAWSPDGTEIACSEFEDGPEKKPAATHFVVNVKTKAKTELKLPADHILTDWSRDGKFLLTSRVSKDPEKPVARLYLMNRDGTEAKALAGEAEYAMVGRLSPDGKRVLCFRVELKAETPAEKKARQEAGARMPPPKRVFSVLDIATGKFAPVADVPLNAEVQGYCWSPDGKKIAFTWRQLHEGKPEDVIEKETESHLVISDPDGANAKTILTEKGAGQWHVVLASVDWQFVAVDAKTDVEKLAGAWKIVSVTDGGKEADADAGTMTFAKDKVTLKRGNQTMDVTIKLDPAKSPKWIDLTVGGKTTLGIYELDADNLKICLNEDRDGKRPDKFVSEPASPNDLLFVLKREK